MSVIAGCAYPEGDASLFAELSLVVQTSRLSPPECRQLALAIADATTNRSEEEAFQLATVWLPALAPVRALLAANPSRARQAFSMVDTILWERSKTRDSGTWRKNSGGEAMARR